VYAASTDSAGVVERENAAIIIINLMSRTITVSLQKAESRKPIRNYMSQDTDTGAAKGEATSHSHNSHSHRLAPRSLSLMLSGAGQQRPPSLLSALWHV